MSDNIENISEEESLLEEDELNENEIIDDYDTSDFEYMFNNFCKLVYDEFNIKLGYEEFNSRMFELLEDAVDDD